MTDCAPVAHLHFACELQVQIAYEKEEEKRKTAHPSLQVRDAPFF